MNTHLQQTIFIIEKNQTSELFRQQKWLSFVWFCCLIRVKKNERSENVFFWRIDDHNNGKSATFALRKANWMKRKERCGVSLCGFIKQFRSLSLSVTTFFSDKLWYSYVCVCAHIRIVVMDNIMGCIWMHVYIIYVCIQNRGWVVEQVILIQRIFIIVLIVENKMVIT